MSDRLGRAAGSGVIWNHPKGLFYLEPLTLRDFGTIENTLLFRKGNPLNKIREALPSIEESGVDAAEFWVKSVREVAKKNKVKSEDVTQWMTTRHGLEVTMFLSVHRSDTSFKLADSRQFVFSLSNDEAISLADAIDVASGLDELSSLDWPENRPRRDECLDEWKTRQRSVATKGDKVLSWRSMFRKLAEAYPWASLNELSGLTYYTARSIIAQESDLGGKQKIPIHEAQEQGLL